MVNIEVSGSSDEPLQFFTALAAAHLVALGFRYSCSDIIAKLGTLICLSITIVIVTTIKFDNSHYYYGGKAREVGPYENPNVFGIIASVGLVVSMGLLLLLIKNGKGPPLGILRNIRTRVACIFAIAVLNLLLAYNVIFSYSRGAWIAAISGITCVACLSCARSNCRAWVCMPIVTKSMRWSVFTLFGGLALMFILYRQNTVGADGVLLGRLISMGDVTDFSWTNRLRAWTAAKEIIRDFPLFGCGWGNLRNTYESYYTQVILPDGGALETCDFLKLGATSGIPVLVAWYTYIYGSIAFCIMECRKRLLMQNGKIDLSLAVQNIFVGLMATLLVGQVFNTILYDFRTAFLMWLLIEVGAYTELHKNSIWVNEIN